MSASKLAKLYSPLDVPVSGYEPFTDYTRWRLLVNDGGRHTWHYMKTDEQCTEWPQNNIDKYWTGQPLNLPALPKATTPLEAARNGFTFFKSIQAHDGHFPCEYGGSMFLNSGLVIGSYCSLMSFTDEERFELIRYMMNHRNPDGGWGVHIEGESCVLSTVLNYVSLRILGMSAEHPCAVKARATLHRLGGAAATPTWGKFWLSILNVYDWEGFNPVPPEFWLLPDWLPIHPHRMWIITRQFYLPMGYLYAIRWQMEENDLIRSLREEIYTTDYYRIYWPDLRNHCSTADRYKTHSTVVDAVNFLLGLYEKCAIPSLRKAALDHVYKHIVWEDENTSYQSVAATSKMMNALVRYIVEGPDTESWRMHARKRADYMWLGVEGMMLTGTNGCQLWDIGFLIHGLFEAGIAQEPENRESMKMVLGWLEGCQMVDNPKYYEGSYRWRSKGGWPFSTRENGYTVSDCTGEGLQSVIYLQEHLEGMEKVVPVNRLFDAVDTMIPMQDTCGGFGSYEPIRAPAWLENLNMSDSFKDIMREVPYPECTSSVITSLAFFRKHYPNYRAADIERTIREGVRYLHDSQRPEGLWFGSWGICFTYATRFALEGLALNGEFYENSPAVRRACNFLLSKQRSDGGWGESYLSATLEHWVDHENTQVVNTAWAVICLVTAKYPNPEPIEKGLKLLMARQLPDGSWPQEAIEGMFNKNSMISYPNFKFVFVIWALGQAHHYLEGLKEKKAGKARQ